MAEVRICAVDGCDKSVWKGLYCPAHYAKARKYGDPLGSAGDRTPVSVHVPLDERIRMNSMPVPHCGCWIWVKSLNGKGYPQLTFRMKRMDGNRAAWVAFQGEIPAGMHVLHKCNTRSCVNPDHLYLGTDVENHADRVAAGTALPPPVLLGEAHAGSILTESQVIAIRASRDRHVDLAARYGVSTHAIAAVRSRKNWGHVK